MQQLVTWSMVWDLIKWMLKFSMPFIVLFILLRLFEKLLISTVTCLRDFFIEKRIKFSKNVIENIKSTDNMTGRQFEIWLKKLLIKSGYSVELTQYSKDRGADLIATNNKGVRIAIQAKKLRRGKVNSHAGGEAWRGMKYHDCHYAVIATNQYFTEQAKEEAKKNKIILWDRDKLMEKLEKLNKIDKK